MKIKNAIQIKTSLRQACKNLFRFCRNCCDFNKKCSFYCTFSSNRHLALALMVIQHIYGNVW